MPKLRSPILKLKAISRGIDLIFQNIKEFYVDNKILWDAKISKNGEIELILQYVVGNSKIPDILAEIEFCGFGRNQIL